MILHELGHAVPAIIFTRRKVMVYIGTYGEEKRSVKIKIGLLELWVKKGIIWNRGLCRTSSSIHSFKARFIFIVCGPIASLICGVICTYIVFNYELHGSLKLIMIYFLAGALWDAITNLIPNPRQIILADGHVIYNDGYQLKLLFELRKLGNEYKEGIDLLDNKNYQEAAEKFSGLMNKKHLNYAVLFRAAINSFYLSRQYKKALEIHETMARKHRLSANDYVTSGLIKSSLNMSHESITDYDKALAQIPSHIYALNNKGYQLTILGKYAEAIPLLDRAISYAPDFAYSYSNRGLARIKTGAINAGLEDIQKSLSLDAENAYAYRNLGIYHLELSETRKALELFLKARNLDPFTHMIDELVESAGEKVSIN